MTYASLDDKKAIEELGQTSSKVADLALTVAKSMDRLIQEVRHGRWFGDPGRGWCWTAGDLRMAKLTTSAFCGAVHG